MCRTCQKLSGGLGNLFFVVAADAFRYAEAVPWTFQKEADTPSRDFCPDCGTQLTARSHRAPSVVLIKVGTLDDPSVFGGPDGVFWTSEKQAFHHLPADVPAHARLPGR
ncbi:MAG TPA: GFA family protein [Rhizomicrobium sp.]|nr:GFA family protein [Rhizomicrobium sp.]